MTTNAPLVVNLSLAGVCRTLVYVVTVLSVFQAVAIAIGSAWYPPQTFLQVLLALLLAAHLVTHLRLSIPRLLRPELLMLALFFVYALASALLLPVVFAGIYVLFPSGGLDEEIISPTPLAFGRGNIGQPLFLLLNLATVLACIVFRGRGFARSLLNYWLLAGGIALFFAAYQKLSMNFGFYFPDALLYSNGGYSVGVGLTLDGYDRINSTFTEPSCAGNVFGAYFCFYLFEFSRTRHPRQLLIAVLYALAIISTASAVGYIEILVTLLLLFVRLSGRMLSALIFLLATAGAIALANLLANELIASVLLNKAASGSFINRTASDLFSIDLALQTQLLGVGLGSNRPSSFITYLLSNVGLFGLLTFTASMAFLLRGQAKQMTTDTPAAAVSAALVVFLAGKAVGVPDINVWFLWVLVGLVACQKATALDLRRLQPYDRVARSPAPVAEAGR